MCVVNFGVVGLEWYPCCNCASACNTDTTPTQPHRNSNTHRTKNNMTNVVIQQNSRKLLMMDILMSETCWTHKKWNKITSDIKLVFYSSTTVLLLSAVAFDRAIYYYYYYYYHHHHHHYLLPLCRVFKIVYLKQTMFLGNAVLQLFCSYSLLYIRLRPTLFRMVCSFN